MGTEAEHQTKASHNHAFLATIAEAYPDWQTTVAFYVAVQLVEARLAKSGLHCPDHHRRKQAVREKFNRISAAYNKLYNASLVARYDPPGDVLPADRVRTELIDKALGDILKFFATAAS